MYRVFIFTVDANDAMYGNDVKFLNEIAKLSHTLVEEVLTHIKNLDNPQVSLFYVYSLKWLWMQLAYIGQDLLRRQDFVVILFVSLSMKFV